MEQKVYDLYLDKTFYQDLLQLICNEISCKLTNLPKLDHLDNSYEYIEDENIINPNECFHLNENAYCIINQQLWQLFTYSQLVTDDNNMQGTWIKLYVHVLDDEEIKQLITNNLINHADFITWIYQRLDNHTINNFLLKSICKDNQTIKFYQSIINQTFKTCLPFLIANQIDVELINDLFPNQINNYLNEEITTNKAEFLKLLKAKPIANQNLQKLIISKLNLNYDDNQTYLVDCELEKQIKVAINQAKQLFDEANNLNPSKLDDLYYQLKNQFDLINKLNKDLSLSCLIEIENDITMKIKEIKDQLIERNFASLTMYAQGNRQILEVELPTLLRINYDQAKGSNQLTDNEIIKKILTKSELKQFKDLQHFNSSFVHGNAQRDSYSEAVKFDEALTKLQEYNQFLSTLKNRIITWKKNNQEKPKKEDK